MSSLSSKSIGYLPLIGVDVLKLVDVEGCRSFVVPFEIFHGRAILCHDRPFGLHDAIR